MQNSQQGFDQSVPFGLVVIDKTQAIHYANPYMAMQVGRSLDEIKGQLFSSVFRVLNQEVLTRNLIWCDASASKATGSDGELAPIEIETVGESGRTRLLHSLMCFAFTDEVAGDCQALLFYEPEPDDAVGLHKGFSTALQGMCISQNKQRRLLMEIERTNDHLIRSEKLAGIGQLASGVAHEINNPVGYVFSNLKTLGSYVQDLLKIIDAVDEAESIDEIRRLKRTLDYDYIRGDVEALIAESEEGIDRVKRIISALKDFSHIDTEGFRLADLHRSINTTLNVASNEIKYKATVIKEYGDLPEIECNASEINQVVLNLVVNAAQAIADTGSITIRTGTQGSDVWFEVQDTGKGMEPSLIERLFEPFFTTKPVGQGTGLGLALSHSIVQKHRGRIDVFSEVGHGTRIRVWLPVCQPSSSVRE
jgi:two-component system NtrC family sensor kinase